jgi:hypothetical protein
VEIRDVSITQIYCSQRELPIACSQSTELLVAGSAEVGGWGWFKSLRCRKFTHNLEKFEEFDDLMSISFMNIPCDTSECHKTISFMVLFCTAYNSAIVRDTNDSFSSIKFTTSATT